MDQPAQPTHPTTWLAANIGSTNGLRYRRLAGIGAAIYLVLASSWIVVSSDFGAGMASSTEALHRFELAKGIAFVAVTTLIFFFVLLGVFREIARREDTIHAQREALLEAERSVTASVLSASVAHDLKNCMTTAHMALDELKATGADLDEEAVAALGESLDAMGMLCEDLVRAGRAEIAGARERFALDDCLRQAVNSAAHHPSTRGAKVSVDSRVDGGEIVGSPALLTRAIVNAIINAGEAGARTILVSARLSDANLELSVDDDGPGIDEDARDRVLDPLFTTKTSGRGLGLSSLVACAQFHDGRVDVGRSDTGGARFTVMLARSLVTQPHQER